MKPPFWRVREFYTATLCSIPGCEKEAWSRGWCNKHYMRWWTHRDPLFTTREPPGIVFRLPEIIEKLENEHGPDNCWPWPFATDPDGRGGCVIDGKDTLAHRAVWESVKGTIPKGKLLCHTCDNAGCVNYRHHYVGTHDDNMRDMVERKRSFGASQPERHRELSRVHALGNRYSTGEKNRHAKLNKSQVAAIRSDGRPTRILAGLYVVDRTTIQRIRSGKIWAE